MPYADPEKERRKKREWIRRKRLNERLEKEKQDPLDLNFGMKLLEDAFPSKEKLEEIFGHEMTHADYIKLKINAQRERKELRERREKEQIAENQGMMLLESFNPKSRGKCIRFRQAYMNNNFANEDFDILNHNCEYCDKWIRSFDSHPNNTNFGGINLHHPEQDVKPEPHHVGHNWKPAYCEKCGALRKYGKCPNGCDSQW